MKKVLMYVLCIPALIGMISCSNAKIDAKQLDGKWNIVEVKGNKVTAKEKTPFMEFNMTENRLHGNAGCNIFNSAIKLDNKDVSKVSFQAPISTMMACPDMTLESVVMKTLEEIASVKAGNTDSEILLVDKGGNTLIVLSKN
ncbi:META domain-containing protein [Parabacteroides sp. PF5-9]|uniref:META domain-containing protein n=1 Tax=Parabacteroides sp. PF5-9 TaxID=1742404 RepID=UPI0024762835|nr:META domain-containing protein [Parabacteroides sp. PF5-9]